MWQKPCRTFHRWCPCIKTRCLLCYHVSYEPGSIGLLKSKAVNMTTSWQSVWQPYKRTHEKGSQSDNFIVVSLTTLQAIKWCQVFYCDGCSAVHKTNIQSKVNGLNYDKNYVQVTFSHIKNKLKIYKLNHNWLYKIHSLPHVHIALFSHSLTHPLTHSLPLAHMATSGSTDQCSMITRRVPPQTRGFAPPSGNTKQCYLATLSSATLVSQRAPPFIEVSPCITAPLPFREHPCHTVQFSSVHSFYFVISDKVHEYKTVNINSKINRRKAHALEHESHSHRYISIRVF